jgi:hypothetical protein
MTESAVVRAFLEGEIERLEPFDFVVIGPAGEPLQIIEVTRSEAGGLEVRVPGRPPFAPELPVPVRSQLRDRGFASSNAGDPSKPWVLAVSDVAAALAAVEGVLHEVFEQKPEVALDVRHGSHRAEHEAQQRLAVARDRIEKIVTEIVGSPPKRDSDGDFVLPVADVHVTVAPRVVPFGPVVVRVFAVTNVGVNVSPDLGLFLARLNFGLTFGRFALDAENRAIWFDEMLMGVQFREEELRFAIQVVASTADEWDDRLKQMFGGATWQEVLTHSQDVETPPTKPGEGGYL